MSAWFTKPCPRPRRLAHALARWLLSSCLLLGALPAASAADLQARLDAVSAKLLGRPYQPSPLGEGKGIDPDPLMRLDAFDCTTYVETVMALAMRNTPAQQLALLERMRYTDGIIDFAHRRHLPASEWLPGLRAMGVLRDVTRKLGGAHTGVVHMHISPALWRHRTWRLLPNLPPSAIPNRYISLPYLPLDRVNQDLANVDRAYVLSVVHREHEGAPLLISHQALLIPGIHGPVVRQARSGQIDMVTEEPLSRFVTHLQHESYWPVLGLNVAEIRAPTPQAPPHQATRGSDLAGHAAVKQAQVSPRSRRLQAGKTQATAPARRANSQIRQQQE